MNGARLIAVALVLSAAFWGLAALPGIEPARAIGASGAGSEVLATAAGGVPEVTGLSPSQAEVGDMSFGITVVGSGFVLGSTVMWNGESRPTGFVSENVLVATINSSDVAAAGLAFVTVSSPGPQGGLAATALVFRVLNPLPAVSALAPAEVWTGAAAFVLAVNGQAFVPGSTVLVGGNEVGTTYLSSQRLQALVPADALLRASALNVRVFTPAPGGGLSPATYLRVRDDDQPPVTTVRGLDGLWHRTPVTLRFSATDVGLGVMATFYRFGRSGIDNVIGNRVTVRAPLDHSNDGIHLVQFWSVDLVGNVEDPPNEVRVGIDTAGPSTRVASATVKKGTTLAVRYRVDDALSMLASDATLQVLDERGKVVLKSSLGQPVTGAWLTAPPLVIGFARGSYRMRVLAHDLAGNAQAAAGSAALRVR